VLTKPRGFAGRAAIRPVGQGAGERRQILSADS